MGEIQVLDAATVDKIAAGEVVERPASVVKELVENAIDSMANAITVEIKDGGIQFIRVTDNGGGIPANQVPTAFLRHATSKIRTATDLIRIHSLGFRGEALSSIAAVAQVELITKTANALTGVRYLIAGGKEVSVEHIGCPEGTTMIVRNLFYNVPARQKFLKTAQTEGAHIYDLIQQLALSHPEISFQFIMNGQNRFHTSGNDNLKDIIYTVYGRDVAGNLLPIEFCDDALTLKLHGYIGKPIISRGNRSFENYYINQRYVKSAVIYKAVEEAYKTFTMIHRFPFVCLCLEMDSNTLDVNVHPSKMELRFHEERRLYDVLKQQVRRVLLEQDLIPELTVGNTNKKAKTAVEKGAPKGAQPFETQRRHQEETRTLSEPSASVQPSASTVSTASAASPAPVQPDTSSVPLASVSAQSPTPDASPAHAASQREAAGMPSGQPQTSSATVAEHHPYTAQPKTFAPRAQQLSFLNEPFLTKQAQPDHRVIGQLFQTYWLIEYDHKLFIMDQHAAHEKVNYERFMKHLKEKKKRYIQQLSPPIVLTLSPQEANTLERYQEYFAQFGFEIDHFGTDTYTIHGVPTDLYGIAEKDAFIGLLDELSEKIHGSDTTMIADKIATMACKASVKGNQRLSFAEAQELIDELLTLDSPFTCPHGRPTVISMTQREIERKFKRIQD